MPLRARGVGRDADPVDQRDQSLRACSIRRRSCAVDTWDYHRMPTMFLSWLRALEDSGRLTLEFTSSRARQCSSGPRSTCMQLDATGAIAIPRTGGSIMSMRASLDGVLEEEALVSRRPQAANRRHRLRHIHDRDLARRCPMTAISRPARVSGALLQEVIPGVVDNGGDVDPVYAGGTFSHAVLKLAKDGEFRVQQDFGGRRRARRAFTWNARGFFADHVMTRSGARRLFFYARVDIVESSRGPLLMELRLIEPELYFLIVSGIRASNGRRGSRRALVSVPPSGAVAGGIVIIRCRACCPLDTDLR